MELDNLNKHSNTKSIKEAIDESSHIIKNSLIQILAERCLMLEDIYKKDIEDKNKELKKISEDIQALKANIRIKNTILKKHNLFPL